MIKNKRAFRIVLALVAMLAIIACAVNPVSGKKELMLFSEKQEIAMGQETDQQIRQQFGIYEDKALNEYVNRIGQSMVPNSHRPNLKHYFAVLDTPVVNAFAAPGGYIYVTRGILALMNSEAELAAVLGHEMGHVAARHSMKQMSAQMLAQVGLVRGQHPEQGHPQVRRPGQHRHAAALPQVQPQRRVPGRRAGHPLRPPGRLFARRDAALFHRPGGHDRRCRAATGSPPFFPPTP